MEFLMNKDSCKRCGVGSFLVVTFAARAYGRSVAITLRRSLSANLVLCLSCAHVCPSCPGRVGSWDSRRSEDFAGDLGDGGRTRQQTCVEKHLTAANCLYISCFRGLAPDPHRGRGLRPQTSCAHPDFTACQPAYATGYKCHKATRPRSKLELVV